MAAAPSQAPAATPGAGLPFLNAAQAASLAAPEAARLLVSDETRGLAPAEAARRLLLAGPNDPAPIRGPGWASLLGRQFKSKLVLILLAATAISAALGEWLNAGAISVTVFVAAAFGFLNEFRSERAMAALRSLTARQAEVVRDGLHEEVPAAEVVPGDLIAVGEGAAIAADARVVEARGLLVNESILTGEPEAVWKAVEPVAGAGQATPATMIYAGTTVAAGSGLALVVATGPATALGGIFAAMEGAGRRATPMEERLERLGSRLIAVFLGLCVLVAMIGLVQGRELRLVLEIAVSLAIGAVPEGLPAVATTTMAVAVRRLAARNVLVRRLDSVETLGSTTVIATDKTGTLTENRMTVRALLLPGGRELALKAVPGDGLAVMLEHEGGPVPPALATEARRLLLVAVLCNDAVVEHDGEQGWHAHGDPSEGAIALASAGLHAGAGEPQREYRRLGTEPFTSATRFMRTTHAAPGGGTLVAVKGAFEQVAALAGGDAGLAARVHELAAGGARIFGVAEGSAAGAVHLLGAIVLEDPLRPDAQAAVMACREAGIRPILVTGDQINTARNVGLATGILAEGLETVRGDDIDFAALDRVAVVARASHAQKEAIVAALQARGEVVAMTGDGVNDAPALRRADVGVAIGPRATDVAMEAADIVVTDGRLDSLVAGIREGRQVARSLQQAIVYLLTASFGTILLISMAMAASDSTPLGPLQILWLNIVVHVFPALALSTGSEGRGASDRPTGELLTAATWLEIGWRAATVSLAAFAALLVSEAWGESEAHGQALVYATLAVVLVGQAFLVGVTSASHQLSRLRRPGVWAAAAVSGSLMVAALYVPGLRPALDLEGIGPGDWGLVAAASAGAWLLGQSLPIVAGTRWSGGAPRRAVA